MNADGYDDIIIGAPEYNSQQGRVYIYFGGSVMDTAHDLRMSGLQLLLDSDIQYPQQAI